MQCPYSFFFPFLFPRFCFSVCILILMLYFLTCSSILCIDVSIQFSMLVTPPPPPPPSFLYSYRLPMSSIRNKALWNFGPFVSVSTLTILRMVPSILQRGLPRCLSHLKRFLLQSLAPRSFLVHLFLFFSTSPLRWWFVGCWLLPVFQSTCNFPYLQAF